MYGCQERQGTCFFLIISDIIKVTSCLASLIPLSFVVCFFIFFSFPVLVFIIIVFVLREEETSSFSPRFSHTPTVLVPQMTTVSWVKSCNCFTGYAYDEDAYPGLSSISHSVIHQSLSMRCTAKSLVYVWSFTWQLHQLIPSSRDFLPFCRQSIEFVDTIS